MEQLSGITFEIKPLSAPTLLADVRSGNYQLTMGSPQAQDMDTALYDRFHTDGSQNYANYSNPKVNAALEASRAIDDQARVMQAYKQLNGELSKDAPVRTWRYIEGYLLVSEAVHGLIPAGTQQGAAFYAEQAWVDE